MNVLHVYLKFIQILKNQFDLHAAWVNITRVYVILKSKQIQSEIKPVQTMTQTFSLEGYSICLYKF